MLLSRRGAVSAAGTRSRDGTITHVEAKLFVSGEVWEEVLTTSTCGFVFVPSVCFRSRCLCDVVEIMQFVSGSGLSTSEKNGLWAVLS